MKGIVRRKGAQRMVSSKSEPSSLMLVFFFYHLELLLMVSDNCLHHKRKLRFRNSKYITQLKKPGFETSLVQGKSTYEKID